MSEPDRSNAVTSLAETPGRSSQHRSWLMALAFSLLFVTLHLAAMRNEILRRRVRALRLMQVAQVTQSSQRSA